MFAPVAGYYNRNSQSSHVNPLDKGAVDSDYTQKITDDITREIQAKKALDQKNKPEALQNRTQEYTVIVKEPKLLGIKLNRDGDSDGAEENYITIAHTKPNPYNIIQYSKLVKFSTGSIEVQLEGLTGEDLKAAFRPLKKHIEAIMPNTETTYVTLTFKSNKQHIPLYPYSVTLTSNIDTQIETNEGKDINDNDVTIITIKDTNNNPYGITDGSRLVEIQYGSNFIEDEKLISITNYKIDIITLKDMIQKINTLDETTHITLYFVSDNPEAPEKATQQGEIAKQIALKTAQAQAEARAQARAQAEAQAQTEAEARAQARKNVVKLAMAPVNAVKAGVKSLLNPHKPLVQSGSKSYKTKRHRKNFKRNKKSTHRKTKRHRKKSKRIKKTYRRKY